MSHVYSWLILICSVCLANAGMRSVQSWQIMQISELYLHSSSGWMARRWSNLPPETRQKSAWPLISMCQALCLFEVCNAKFYVTFYTLRTRIHARLHNRIAQWWDTMTQSLNWFEVLLTCYVNQTAHGLNTFILDWFSNAVNVFCEPSRSEQIECAWFA